MTTYQISTTEFVDLVQTMRKVQKEYFAMVTERGQYTQHQRTRVLQAAKAAERKVDAWIEKHLKESRDFYAAQGDYSATELPGIYKEAK